MFPKNLELQESRDEITDFGPGHYEEYVLIKDIEKKVESIKENYQVKISTGVNKFKYRNFENLKELVQKKSASSN